MKKVSNKILLGLLCLVAGCRSTELAPGQYAAFVEDPANGLQKISTVGEWVYKVQYRTPEYQLCKEMDMQSVSVEEYRQSLAQKGQVTLFNVYVEHKTFKQSNPLKLVSKDMSEYSEREGYLLGAAGGDFSLVRGSDTLSPIAYHFEPNYGLSPYDVIVVGFPVRGQAGDMTLLYHDKVLRTGIIQFKFSNSDLQNIPSLRKL